MNNRQSKKLRQLHNRDLKIKYKELLIYFINLKPWYIPKFLWLYWLKKQYEKKENTKDISLKRID